MEVLIAEKHNQYCKDLNMEIWQHEVLNNCTLRRYRSSLHPNDPKPSRGHIYRQNSINFGQQNN